MKKNEKSIPNMRMTILCLSACYIAIGAVLLAFPGMALRDICYAIGIVVIIIGLVNVAFYFLRKNYADPNSFGFAAGVAEFMLGLFAVLKTEDFTRTFSQILALCMIFDSIVKLQFSMDLLRIKNKKWWVVLFIALVTAGVSMAILVAPFGSEETKNLYTYIVLIADGAVNILTTLYLSLEFKKYNKLKAKEASEKTE